MSIVAKKIMMGSGAVALPSDSEFNRTSFLSHFDGSNDGVNNQFTDGSASNHTITANGNVTQGSFGPFARPDGEWAFNNTASTNDSFKVTAHDNFDMTNPFTIEGWIFIPDLTVNKLLFGRENNYWMTHDYQGIGGASGKFGFNYRNSGSWGAINASAATVANTWYFLQATYVGTTVTFYINGASQGTASVGSPSSNTDKPFYVLSGPGAKYTGTASNVRLSSVARSTSLPTAKFTSDSDTELLVCQSNRFVDNGPDGHTITTTAGASVSAFGPFLTSSVYDPAVNGASLGSDGSGDYLTIPQTTDMDLPANFTVECWVYLNQVDKTQVFIGKWGGNSKYGWVLYVRNNGEFAFFSGNNGSTGTQLLSNVTATAGQWYHIAACRTSSTVSYFVNGVRTATGSDSNNMSASSSLTYIATDGSAISSNSVNGFLCDARVIKGTAAYDGATYTIPTAPLTAVTNTKLLLNMADGQAIDSAAQSEWTATTVANGTPKLQTGQKKIGTSSLYFDGSSNYYFPNGFLPGGTGDFTIEFWFRTSNTNDNATILTAGGIYFQFYQNKLRYFPYNGGAYIDSSTISTNTWYHVAGVRSGTTFYYFLDGTSQGTLTSVTAAVSNGAGYFGMNGSNPYTGYIDEMRISRMARYTSNFTPDTEPFADKGK